MTPGDEAERERQGAAEQRVGGGLRHGRGCGRHRHGPGALSVRVHGASGDEIFAGDAGAAIVGGGDPACDARGLGHDPIAGRGRQGDREAREGVLREGAGQIRVVDGAELGDQRVGVGAGIRVEEERGRAGGEGAAAQHRGEAGEIDVGRTGGKRVADRPGLGDDGIAGGGRIRVVVKDDLRAGEGRQGGQDQSEDEAQPPGVCDVHKKSPGYDPRP